MLHTCQQKSLGSEGAAGWELGVGSWGAQGVCRGSLCPLPALCCSH